MYRLAAGALAVALSACSGGIVGGAAPPPRPVQSAPPVATTPAPAFRAPRVQNQRGLENILGQRADALTRRFGQARIDLEEGDARKLQFVGGACVLDIYLYPPEQGAEPVASYAAARLRKGGAETDRASCIRSIEAAR